MVEQQPITGVHPIALAVVDCDPVRIKLHHPAGTTRIKGCFPSAASPEQTKELAGARLVDPCFVGESQDPHRFKNPKSAQCITISGVLRTFKTHCYMALGAKVVDLVRLNLLNDPDQIGAVG